MTAPNLMRWPSRLAQDYEVAAVAANGSVVLAKRPRDSSMSFPSVDADKRKAREGDDQQAQPARPPPALAFDDDDMRDALEDGTPPEPPVTPPPGLVGVDEDDNSDSEADEGGAVQLAGGDAPPGLVRQDAQDSVSGDSDSLFGGADSTDDDSARDPEPLPPVRRLDGGSGEGEQDELEDTQLVEDSGGLAPELFPPYLFVPLAAERELVAEKAYRARLRAQFERADADLLVLAGKLAAVRASGRVLRVRLRVMSPQIQYRGYAAVYGIYADYECEIEPETLRIADRRVGANSAGRGHAWPATQHRVAFACTVLAELGAEQGGPDDTGPPPPFTALDGASAVVPHTGLVVEAQSALRYEEVFDAAVNRDLDGLQSEGDELGSDDSGTRTVLTDRQRETLRRLRASSNRFYASHSGSSVLALVEFD